MKRRCFVFSRDKTTSFHFFLNNIQNDVVLNITAAKQHRLKQPSLTQNDAVLKQFCPKRRRFGTVEISKKKITEPKRRRFGSKNIKTTPF